MNEQTAQQIVALLQRIANQLDTLTAGTAPASPNYQRPLAAFASFDWASIGAAVTASDANGAAIVQWANYQWTRRSGSGKFGQAIWFSRATGTGENGTEYARLITFKDRGQAEPVTVTVPASVAATTRPTPPPAQPKAAKTAGNGNGHAPRAAHAGSALFEYAYGDGQKATARLERAAFDSYRRAHGEQSPANVAALRAWYKQKAS